MEQEINHDEHHIEILRKSAMMMAAQMQNCYRDTGKIPMISFSKRKVKGLRGIQQLIVDVEVHLL